MLNLLVHCLRILTLVLEVYLLLRNIFVLVDVLIIRTLTIGIKLLQLIYRN